MNKELIIIKENFEDFILCEKCLCWKGKYKDLEIELWYDDYEEQLYNVVCFCENISCNVCDGDLRPKPGTFFWPLENDSMVYVSGLEWNFKCNCCGEDYDFIEV